MLGIAFSLSFVTLVLCLSGTSAKIVHDYTDQTSFDQGQLIFTHIVSLVML